MNRWFVNGLQELGYDVVVADPVLLQLKLTGKKTDRRDAREIARRLHLGDIDRQAGTYYPTEQEYGERKLLRTRRKLVSIRQQLVNQIRAMLTAYNLPSPGRDLTTGPSLDRLRGYQWPSAGMDAAIQALISSLSSVQESVKALSKKIRQTAARDPKISLAMKQLPSVGAQTALTLVRELGDPHRFVNAKAAASFAGLVPSVSSSADRAHHGRLTKRGNREMRFILGQWATRLMARDQVVKRWAARHLKHKHKNKVKIALSRRLLVGVFVMLNRGEAFSMKKCLAG
jgi:transposase